MGYTFAKSQWVFIWHPLRLFTILRMHFVLHFRHFVSKPYLRPILPLVFTSTLFERNACLVGLLPFPLSLMQVARLIKSLSLVFIWCFELCRLASTEIAVEGNEMDACTRHCWDRLASTISFHPLSYWSTGTFCSEDCAAPGTSANAPNASLFSPSLFPFSLHVCMHTHIAHHSCVRFDFAQVCQLQALTLASWHLRCDRLVIPLHSITLVVDLRRLYWCIGRILLSVTKIRNSHWSIMSLDNLMHFYYEF